MFDCVVISGGSTKGFIGPGIFSKHEGEMRDVRRYVGTSVGAVLCTLLSIGTSWETIMDIGRSSSCKLPSGVGWLLSASSFFTKLGFIHDNTYLDTTSAFMYEKYGRIPTLSELHKITGKDLLIVASGVVSRKRVVFYHRSHPDMSVIDALHMSIRMPLIFTPIQYGGDLIVDGGVRSHFPIDLRVGRTLAIHTYNEVRSSEEMLKNPSILEYVSALLSGDPSDIPTNMNGVLYDIAYQKVRGMTVEEEATHMFNIGRGSVPVVNN